MLKSPGMWITLIHWHAPALQRESSAARHPDRQALAAASRPGYATAGHVTFRGPGSVHVQLPSWNLQAKSRSGRKLSQISACSFCGMASLTAGRGQCLRYSKPGALDPECIKCPTRKGAILSHSLWQGARPSCNQTAGWSSSKSFSCENHKFPRPRGD